MGEYRKTIGKDAALERRFQPVTIDKPRRTERRVDDQHPPGLEVVIEAHHGVEISDGALVTGESTFLVLIQKHADHLSAAVYGARYTSDRFLLDKAIDLADEAASALRLAQESKPDEPEALDRDIMTLQIELESLKNETDVFSVERRAKVEDMLRRRREDAARLQRTKGVKVCLEQAKPGEVRA